MGDLNHETQNSTQTAVTGVFCFKKQQHLSKTHLKKTHTHTHTHKHTHPYLLNVPVEAEEVEDAGAVHLGWMEATHHGDRAGGVARV